MKILIRKIGLMKTILIWLYSNITWFFIFIFNQKKQNNFNDKNFCIGITTFKDRYNSSFKPLLKKIVFLFPDIEIIIAVNGHVDQENNELFIKKIKSHIKEYSNVKIIIFKKPQGLSKLWNQIIINSRTQKIILLNDDLDVKRSFRKDLEKSSCFLNDISLLNSSWSHFIISREIIKIVGWFDERLLEIGGEDDDYSARLSQCKIEVKNINCNSIKNSSIKHKVNSYGHDMTGEFPYSKLNTEILFKKWEVSNFQIPDSVIVENRFYKYWKIKENMETPDFYPEISLNV